MTSTATVKSIANLETVQYFAQKYDQFYPSEEITPEAEIEFPFHDFAFGLVDKSDDYFLDVPKSIGSYRIMTRQRINDGRTDQVFAKKVESRACTRVELGLTESDSESAKFFAIKTED